MQKNIFSANRRGITWERVSCPSDNIRFDTNTFIGGGKIESGAKYFTEVGRLELSSWPAGQSVATVFALLYRLAALAGPSGNHVDLDEALSGTAAREFRLRGPTPTVEEP